MILNLCDKSVKGLLKILDNFILVEFFVIIKEVNKIMYKALYRKYRPKDFDQMLGQDAVVRSIKNQIKNNEVSHAYLFSGTRGTGKTSAAKIFARAVNCENPIDGNPCNECKSCLSILNNTAVDVVEMDAASNNGVDDIRELKEKVIYPPTFLKYKVYIIDEVHMLSKGAFNALLKILEEPPGHLIFILATTEVEKIPATILSRSQKFEFSRLSNEDIVKNLKNICKLEGKTLDEEVYSLVAKNSDGAMRDALSVLDQLLSFDSDKIALEDALNILGISSLDDIFEFTDALIKKDALKAINSIDKIALQGKDFLSLNNQLLSHFRDLMLVKTLKNPENLVYSTYLTEFKAQALTCDLDDILDILEDLKDLQGSLKYAESPRILLEMTAIKICNKKSWRSLEKNVKDLQIRLEELEKKFINSEEIFENTFENTKEDNLIIDDTLKTLENSNNNDIIKKSEDKISKANEEYDKNNEDKNLEKYGADDKDLSFKNESKAEKKDAKLSINDFKRDWINILEDLKSINQIPLVGLLNDARPYSFENNILDICYGPGHEFHLSSTNEPKRLESIRSVLKERYGLNIDVKVSLEEDSTLKKLEDLFGKDMIKNI